MERATKHNLAIPPDPDNQNNDRAKWALAGVQAFADGTGIDLDETKDGIEMAISDLLCDLGHLCDHEAIELPELLWSAAKHYQEETAQKGKQLL